MKKILFLTIMILFWQTTVAKTTPQEEKEKTNKIQLTSPFSSREWNNFSKVIEIFEEKNSYLKEYNDSYFAAWSNKNKAPFYTERIRNIGVLNERAVFSSILIIFFQYELLHDGLVLVSNKVNDFCKYLKSENRKQTLTNLKIEEISSSNAYLTSLIEKEIKLHLALKKKILELIKQTQRKLVSDQTPRNYKYQIIKLYQFLKAGIENSERLLNNIKQNSLTANQNWISISETAKSSVFLAKIIRDLKHYKLNIDYSLLEAENEIQPMKAYLEKFSRILEELNNERDFLCTQAGLSFIKPATRKERSKSPFISENMLSATLEELEKIYKIKKTTSLELYQLLKVINNSPISVESLIKSLEPLQKEEDSATSSKTRENKSK